MTTEDWRQFLQQLSRTVLELDAREQPELRMFSPETHQAGYIGHAGASARQIEQAEVRLGASLPPSYRTFLSVSNGWPQMARAAMPGALLPVERLFWIRDHDPEGIMGWGNSDNAPDATPEQHRAEADDTIYYRMAYIPGLLSISGNGDASCLLLSPQVVDEHGAWECWNFAVWHPGFARFHAFDAWMAQAHSQLMELQTDE